MFKKLIISLVIILILMLSSCFIKGKVVDENGAGVAGVTITLSDNDDPEKAEINMTTTTDSAGNYQFGSFDERLPIDKYRVTPSKSGYTFTPALDLVEIEGFGEDEDIPNPVSGVDFVVVKEERKYYVFKIWGTGYRKTWGAAEKITGYDFRYRYIYPSEVDDVKSWLGNFEEATETSCEAGSPICPCPPYPDIWEVGEIEVVSVFDTYEEVEENYRCDNPHYMGFTFLCNMWTSEWDTKYWDKINEICGE